MTKDNEGNPQSAFLISLNMSFEPNTAKEQL